MCLRDGVFNPEGDGGWGSTLAWNPVAVCESGKVAFRRAEALTHAVSVQGTDDGSFWQAKASQMFVALFHAAALLWVAGIGHLLHGNVDLHATAWLLLGSIPGILVASKFTVRIPDRILRLGLALVLGLSGLKLLEVPYASWIRRRLDRGWARARRIRRQPLAGASAPHTCARSVKPPPKGRFEMKDCVAVVVLGGAIVRPRSRS